MRNQLRFFYPVCVALGLLLFAACGEKPTNTTAISEEGKPDMKGNLANTDPLLIEIHDMEHKAKLDSVMDRAVGLRLLRAYQEYYNKHPKDSLGQAYLFEAARVADAMMKYQKAIELLINYHDAIGNLDKKAEATYMIAFIYDAHLQNATKATDYYNHVIELYPNSIWAQQSKDALHLVGKSDEELLRFLEEKNKQPA